MKRIVDVNTPPPIIKMTITPDNFSIFDGETNRVGLSSVSTFLDSKYIHTRPIGLLVVDAIHRRNSIRFARCWQISRRCISIEMKIHFFVQLLLQISFNSIRWPPKQKQTMIQLIASGSRCEKNPIFVWHFALNVIILRIRRRRAVFVWIEIRNINRRGISGAQARQRNETVANDNYLLFFPFIWSIFR